MALTRTRAVALGSTVALGIGLVATNAGAASAAYRTGRGAATTSWVPTATKAMTSEMQVLKATDLGATSASTPVRLALGLQVRNAAGLKALARAVSTPDSANDQHFLTPAGFLADYAPTAAQVKTVSSYLTQQGFTGVSVASNRLYVSADGTAGQAESAFNTQLENYRLNGKTAYVNISPAEVPASLGGTVLSVLGLENIVSFDYKPLVNTKHVTPAVRPGATAVTAPPTSPCALPPDPAPVVRPERIRIAPATAHRSSRLPTTPRPRRRVRRPPSPSWPRATSPRW